MKTKWTREDVGGDYFHPKVDGKILKSVLLRDCRGVGNNCDYEMITKTEDGISVGPIFKEWFDNGMVSYWIKQEGK